MAKKPAAKKPAAKKKKAPKEVLVTVTKSPMSVVHLHVHGVGAFKLPVGEERKVPVEALDALKNSNVEFETKKA
jgi:hypothetical protein